VILEPDTPDCCYDDEWEEHEESGVIDVKVKRTPSIDREMINIKPVYKGSSKMLSPSPAESFENAS
jgi:hypothetical protein